MAEGFRPETAEQVREAVAWAVSEAAPLEICGGGSKRRLGRPIQTSRSLDLSALSGVELYEPEELILAAKAGTPMSEIETLLQENRQQLAFEPADLGPLLGGASEAAVPGGTLGGAVACNLSGPRRIKAGAARDHLLGFTAVSGRGEIYKSGGRVVKNVTGYDLCKLLTGSYGTLSAMTDLTVKVLPAPEKTRTVLLFGLDDRDGSTAMTRALKSSHELSAAAHLPTRAATSSEVSYVSGAGGAVTALRVEGPAPSVEHRCAALRRELADLGESEELHGHNSAAFWREVRDALPLARLEGLDVWRASVAPNAGAGVVEEIGSADHEAYFFDWGGGLVWLGLKPADDASADRVRGAVAKVGGHATLIRAGEAVRSAVPVFQPQDAASAALSRRVKQGFDPAGVLNPGRMYAGV